MRKLFHGTSRSALFLILGLLGLACALYALGPMAQPGAWLLFADDRKLWGIPHFGDVISNLAFLAAGGAGLGLLGYPKASETAKNRAYRWLFLSVTMTAVGSTLFHWEPSLWTLFLDRLPMTVAFASLLSALVMEIGALQLGQRLLVPVSIFSVSSVVYWYGSERLGQGDLRWYLWVQLSTMLLIPLLLLLYRPERRVIVGYAGLTGSYVAAKLCEYADEAIYHWTGWISGHTLKHLLAAIGVLFILPLLRRSSLATEGE